MTGFMLYQKLNGKWRDDKMSDKYQNTEFGSNLSSIINLNR